MSQARKISVTTNYLLTYRVKYFRSEEGGMDSEQYGKDVYSEEEAISLWDLARQQSNDNWIIAINVEKVVGSNTKATTNVVKK